MGVLGQQLRGRWNDRAVTSLPVGSSRSWVETFGPSGTGVIGRTLLGVNDSTVVEICRVLGDPVRWKIVSELRCESRCACELGAASGATPSLLSHHLGVLRDAGVVTAKRRGRWIDYTLASDVLDELVAEIQMPTQQDGDSTGEVAARAATCESVEL